MDFVYFVIGLVIGAIVGVLVYRNNAKKIEREAKEKVNTMKREIKKLRKVIDNK